MALLFKPLQPCHHQTVLHCNDTAVGVLGCIDGEGEAIRVQTPFRPSPLIQESLISVGSTRVNHRKLLSQWAF